MPTKNKQIRKYKKGDKLFRTFEVNRADVNEDDRTVPIAFSSETEVDRYFGIEVLDHDPQSVRLDRLNNGGAVLVEHNTDKHVGVVESANIDGDSVARAIVRFGKSAYANEIFDDVKDGIRQLVSVGYRIYKFTEEEKNGNTYVRAIDWEPYEVSFVSIPADVAVGVGRSIDEEETLTINREAETMTTKVKDKEENTPAGGEQHRAQAPTPIDPDKELKKLRTQETERVNSIRAAAGENDLDELGRRAIDDGMSYAEFNVEALKEIGKRNAAAREESEESGDLGLSRKDKKRFSMTRLMYALANPNDRSAQNIAGHELEVGSEAAKQFGDDFKARGSFIPNEILFGNIESRDLDKVYESLRAAEISRWKGQRDLSAGTATDGAELVAANLLAGSFIDVLRNAMVTVKAGARMLPGLVGTADIPRKTSGAASGWISAEDGDAANSDAQFDQVALTPKDLACYTQVTRRLLLQSTPAIEGIVRDDLAIAQAIGLDLAALYGSGASGQPTGVANQTGINTFNFAAAAPTYPETVRMIKETMLDNSLLGSLAYIIDPEGWDDAMTTEKATGTAKFIMDESNRINGYGAHVTNQVTAEDWFFGNFSDILIGEWGGMELNVDPYTHSLKGKVRFITFKTADVVVRHPTSFCHCNDGV